MKRLVIAALVLLSLFGIATAETGKIIHDGSQVGYFQGDTSLTIPAILEFNGFDSYLNPGPGPVPFPDPLFQYNAEIIFEDSIFEKIWSHIYFARRCSYGSYTGEYNDSPYAWGGYPKYLSSNPPCFVSDSSGKCYSKFEAYEKGIWSNYLYIVRMFAWCDDLSVATGTFGFTKASFETIYPGVDSTHPWYESYLSSYEYDYVSNPNKVYILYAPESMKEAVEAHNQEYYNQIYVWKYVTNRPTFQIIGE